ncbi:hypothetical protein DPMN_101245 [Dreissena polymorpha]|uniref:Uncharacterized protein n=1 Tax=Dreissena polymorpha TaxID=45954 RepID=A0A9D4R9G8_DREPO|nr:hypothetical protein DPMN_101245 [Dreissena polymorpha]
MHEHLSAIYYRLSDQYSKAVQVRRRKLVSYFIQARKDGKQASLCNDALYVDRVKYTHDHPPPGLYRRRQTEKPMSQHRKLPSTAYKLGKRPTRGN